MGSGFKKFLAICANLRCVQASLAQPWEGPLQKARRFALKPQMWTLSSDLRTSPLLSTPSASTNSNVHYDLCQNPQRKVAPQQEGYRDATSISAT
mmetsp:Transcript_69386/g.226000  ORF Transcript_69386/g.226000 Transcript_69386/m.226000 type:complete len:95 (-) Transcript_69386:179-463(-)